MFRGDGCLWMDYGFSIGTMLSEYWACFFFFFFFFFFFYDFA